VHKNETTVTLCSDPLLKTFKRRHAHSSSLVVRAVQAIGLNIAADRKVSECEWVDNFLTVPPTTFVFYGLKMGEGDLRKRKLQIFR
jgi:hypothetical protein